MSGSADRTEAPIRPPLTVIYAITVTGITLNTLVSSQLPEILDGLGASRGLSGLVIGAGTLPGIVLAPVIGLLADRFGRREVLVPCLVVFGIAGGLGALAPSLWVLVLLRFFQGAGSAGLVNLAVVTIGDYWEGTDRARMIGRNSAVLTASLAVLPTIGGLLTDAGSWRTPFLAYPLSLVTGWIVFRTLPKGQRSDVTVRDQVREALPLLRSRAVLTALVAGAGTFALIFGLLLTVLPNYLEAAFGIRPSLRGLFLGLPALTNTAVALSLGRLRARFARHVLLAAAAVVFGVALIVVAGAPTLLVLGGGILLFGAGEGLMVPNLQDLAAGAGSAATRGTAVALFVSGARGGQTAGPLLAGAGLAVWGARATFAAGAILAFALVALVASGAARRGDLE